MTTPPTSEITAAYVKLGVARDSLFERVVFLALNYKRRSEVTQYREKCLSKMDAIVVALTGDSTSTALELSEIPHLSLRELVNNRKLWAGVFSGRFLNAVNEPDKYNETWSRKNCLDLNSNDFSKIRHTPNAGSLALHDPLILQAIAIEINQSVLAPEVRFNRAARNLLAATDISPDRSDEFLADLKNFVAKYERR